MQAAVDHYTFLMVDVDGPFHDQNDILVVSIGLILTSIMPFWYYVVY